MAGLKRKVNVFMETFSVLAMDTAVQCKVTSEMKGFKYLFSIPDLSLFTWKKKSASKVVETHFEGSVMVKRKPPLSPGKVIWNVQVPQGDGLLTL